MIIGIENKDSDGYRELQNLVDKIIDLFTEEPTKLGGYSLKQDEFEGELEEDLSTGDYWIYILKIKAMIPVKETSIIKKMGW